jgi:photosystem II stability/assembly factor-like uncharacterized protein
MDMPTRLRPAAILLLLALIPAGCSPSAVPVPALADDSGTQDLLAYLRESGREAEVELGCGDMASLPDGTIFLTGGYSSGDTVRTALLISRDGGQSWKDSGMGYLSSGFGTPCTWGDSNVWMVLSWAVESSGPTAILASQDAGRTWAAYPLDLGHGSSPGCVMSLSFKDAENGRLVADYGTEDDQEDYATTDGGRSWHRVGSHSYVLPPPAEPAESDVSESSRVEAVGPLWKKEGGQVKPAGRLRTRSEDGDDGLPLGILVEKQDGGADAPWQQVSRIPARYKVLPKGRLEPICPPNLTGGPPP